eukprot:CAMPEP_0113609292 /NCGR_PEP_ID=MMETSP0017_2-20120614/4409_1 /TAXON_ID=2856 /ORGANISM="Cylindrotheca closterium" /LENGTH=63 /DNA_ID=CAMNT_0000518091 /DNA_START=229 /DNA_END=417 /DNA_ORIENTATION=+ /assembly_acc=CAM_ASM_000147
MVFEKCLVFAREHWMLLAVMMEYQWACWTLSDWTRECGSGDLTACVTLKVIDLAISSRWDSGW